ncbi:MAG: PEP-CTERM sorting domain-containing protein [Phycisphaeraceae bacterium]
MGAIRFRLMATFIALAMASQASAVLTNAFDWQGDYVAVNQTYNVAAGAISGDFDGDADATDNGFRRTYSESTKLNPGGGYKDNTGGTIVGSDFYGGYQMISYDIASPAVSVNNSVNQSGTVDRLRGQMNVGANGGEWAFFYSFLQGDFINGLDTASLSGDVMFTYQNQGGVANARMVVKDGGNFFVSSAMSSGTALFTLDSSATTWAAYDPNSNLNFDQSQIFSAMSFSNITGFGVYLEDDAASVTGDWRFRQFTAAVNVADEPAIPEPATAGLALLGLSALAARRRRIA